MSQGVITSYAWAIESSKCSAQVLTEEIVLTSTSSSLLVLKPNTLAPGLRVKFTIRLEDSQGEVGVASVAVHANRPPGGGGMTVVPSSGIALRTHFDLEASQWTPYVADNLPLQYDFYAVLSNGSSVSERQMLSLSAGSAISISSLLPAADPRSDYLLTTGVEVSDALGTSVETVVNVTVRPPSDQDYNESVSEAMDEIGQLIDKRNLIAAQGLVGVVAQTLNQAADVCQGNLEPECLVGACCERKYQKFRLFLMLKDADSKMLFSATKVASEVKVLAALTARPSELGYDIVKEMNKFLKARFEELAQPGIGSTLKDSVSLASNFGTGKHKLLLRRVNLFGLYAPNSRADETAVLSTMLTITQSVSSGKRVDCCDAAGTGQGRGAVHPAGN